MGFEPLLLLVAGVSVDVEGFFAGAVSDVLGPAAAVDPDPDPEPDADAALDEEPDAWA